MKTITVSTPNQESIGREFMSRLKQSLNCSGVNRSTKVVGVKQQAVSFTGALKEA